MTKVVRRKIVEALAHRLVTMIKIGDDDETRGAWSATVAVSEVLPGNLFEEVNIRVKELMRDA